MKFSVIIPVYNIADYIQSTLDSVVRAAMSSPANSVEVICVDDGSMDGCSALLDKFAASVIDLRPGTFSFRVVHQKNAGVGAARNAALGIATGDYICFVDGDDGVVQWYFSRLSSIIGYDTPDIVRFAYHEVSSPSDSIATSRNYGSISRYDLSCEKGAIDGFRNVVGSTWAWNAAYRRDSLGGLRFHKLPNGEDILFAAEALMRAATVFSVGDKLYLYTLRGNSAVHTISTRHLLSVCEMACLLKEAVGVWRFGSSVQEYLKRRLRVHLITEVACEIGKLNSEDRQAVWETFFNALGRCSWSFWTLFVAHVRSPWLVNASLVSVQRLRHAVYNHLIARRR